jgi:predicted RNA-binding protein with PIN domain
VPILIDGNNLLHTLPAGQRSRAELRRLCLELVRGEGAHLILVFDGAPPAGTPSTERMGRVTVLYAAPLSADDAILARLPHPPETASWVVVTDDRQLRERVRQSGAKLRSLRDFRSKLIAAAQRPREEEALSPAELAEWEELFSSPSKRGK